MSSETENKRSDSEIIRKAVELADGWEMHDKWFCALLGTHAGEAWLEDQYVLDALAAQLVRQVDATDRYSFFSHRDCATVTEYVDGYPNEKGGAIGRDNRTMNTIKAIVESGVLEQ